MPVESREEPKPVLGREIFAAGSCSVWYREASRLAAKVVSVFVDGDLVSTFHQFMCGAQPGDAAAKYRNARGHDDRISPRKWRGAVSAIHVSPQRLTCPNLPWPHTRATPAHMPVGSPNDGERASLFRLRCYSSP